MKNITWNEFKNIEMRVGTIVEVEDSSDAINPAYQIKINFGEKLGIKKSSAQITDLYSKKDLINKQIIAVVNFSPKQIGRFMSECLITGFYNMDEQVILATPDQLIENGALLA